MTVGIVHRLPEDQHDVPHVLSCRALDVSDPWFYEVEGPSTDKSGLCAARSSTRTQPKTR